MTWHPEIKTWGVYTEYTFNDNTHTFHRGRIESLHLLERLLDIQRDIIMKETVVQYNEETVL